MSIVSNVLGNVLDNLDQPLPKRVSYAWCWDFVRWHLILGLFLATQAHVVYTMLASHMNSISVKNEMGF